MMNKRGVLHLAALVGPILVVQGFRLISGAAPTAAIGATTDVDPLVTALAPASKSEPTTEQAEAIRWLSGQSRRVDASPMNHGAPPIVIETTPVAPVEPPTLSVTSIVTGAGGVIATINGRRRRVGDAIGDGWSIREIDFKARCVVVGHTSGRTVRAYLSEIGHDLDN